MAGKWWKGIKYQQSGPVLLCVWRQDSGEVKMASWETHITLSWLVQRLVPSVALTPLLFIWSVSVQVSSIFLPHTVHCDLVSFAWYGKIWLNYTNWKHFFSFFHVFIFLFYFHLSFCPSGFFLLLSPNFYFTKWWVMSLLLFSVPSIILAAAGLSCETISLCLSLSFSAKVAGHILCDSSVWPMTIFSHVASP